MPNIRLTLQAFGLQAVNSAIYRRNIGDYPSTRGAEGFETSSDYEDPIALTKGAPDVSRIGQIGNLIFSDLVFPSDDGDIVLENILLEINRENNIIKTPIRGRKSTVKEYYAPGDYTISGKGLLVTPDNSFPVEESRILNEHFNRGETLEVVSDYLRIFSIYNLVVDDFGFVQIEGYQNTHGFTFEASSDEPLELIEDVEAGQ